MGNKTFTIHNQLFQSLFLAVVQKFCLFGLLKMVQGFRDGGTQTNYPPRFLSDPVKVPKSPSHYGQTVGLVEYISISLTATKGLNGTDVTVRHTLPVFERLPLLTRQTVIVLRAATCHTIGVTLLAVIGVFVAIETIRTH